VLAERGINRAVLVVMQTLHRQVGAALALDPLHSGMLRLITDHFAGVRLMAPVLTDSDEFVVPYPSNFTYRPLYRRTKKTGRLEMLFKHLASVPPIIAEVARADVVHVRLPAYPAACAGMVAVLLGKTIVPSFHGSSIRGLLPQRPRGFARAYKAPLAWLWGAVSRVIARRGAVTLVAGEGLRGETGGHGHTVGFHQFSEREVWKRSDTCHGPLINLLYVGRLSVDKGTPLLLEAFARLARLDSRCRLLLVGTPWKLDVEAEMRRLGLAGSVTLAGVVPFGPRLLGIYRESDILVFPSLHEGVPKVPMEALSQSLPVVTTRAATGGYLESDPEAIYEAARRLINDGDLRRLCIANGRTVAIANCRERVAEHIDALLHDGLA
jgi:glycosyltransferase involved in cell wall biosynthesis